MNEDLDRFLVWRREISVDLGVPMPIVIDPEEGVLAEVCGECDKILAVIKVVDHGMSVEVHETEHGATLLL